ncbi:MAG: hypothetical protein AAFY31_11725, partial [Pseudomonadota bacterium]
MKCSGNDFEIDGRIECPHMDLAKTPKQLIIGVQHLRKVGSPDDKGDDDALTFSSPWSNQVR